MAQQMTDEQRRELEERIKNMSPEELKEFQKQQCVFCQIIAGRIPSKKVYEDEKCLAVMDINPATVGHVLLLPKEHYSIMPQVPEEEIGHLFMVAKHISHAMLKKLKVEGTNIFAANGQVAGQRAQHFMIHIIPRRDGDGVLDIPTNLVDKNMREKIAEVVKRRVNELFGIKEKLKKNVKVEEKPEEAGDKEEPEKEEKEQVEEEIPPTHPQLSTKKTVKKKPKKESEEKEEDAAKGKDEEEQDKEDVEEVNLDDIADLFR